MRALIVAAVAAVTLTACPGPPDPGVVGPTTPAGPPVPDLEEGVARLQGCEPATLLPAGIADDCGRVVGDGLFTRLVHLDPLTGAPSWGGPSDRAMASSITSSDGRRWLIEIQDGWTFHDGEPVTAQSFVDAWNFAASGSRGQRQAHLFSRIVGFGEVHCPEPACEPEATQMRGLRVTDDLQIEVTLASAYRDFPRVLGSLAYAPLPPSALADPNAWVEAPIGNGPLRMEGVWEHDQLIRLRPADEYSGPPATVEGVDIVLYGEPARAWEDLRAGRLDVATTLDDEHLAAARASFRQHVVPGDDYEFLVVPSYLDTFDDPRLARALSLALDRDALVDELFDSRAARARGLVPVSASDEADRCGAVCRFRPQQARELLEAAGGVPEGGLTVWYDRDTDQGDWVVAVADHWRRVLRLDPAQVRVQSLPHTSWVSHLQDRRLNGVYALGWSADVRSPREYLEELHTPSGLFDFDGYRGGDVLDTLQQAGRAPTPRLARLAYRRAEQMILADMHHIPLWVRSHEVFHGDRVDDVTVDGLGVVQVADLVVTG